MIIGVKEPVSNPGGLDQTPQKQEDSKTESTEIDKTMGKRAEDTTPKTVTINKVKQMPISSYTVTQSVADRARMLSAAAQHREASRMSASFASPDLKNRKLQMKTKPEKLLTQRRLQPPSKTQSSSPKVNKIIRMFGGKGGSKTETERDTDPGLERNKLSSVAELGQIICLLSDMIKPNHNDTLFDRPITPRKPRKTIT